MAGAAPAVATAAASGALDPSFGNGGKVLANLARVNADGTVDQSFGTGGTVTTTFQGNESVGSILVQPDGKIVAVGYSENNATGEADVALARHLP